MGLQPDLPPEPIRDDQSGDISHAMYGKSWRLSLNRDLHEDNAQGLEESGADEDVVEEERSLGIEFLDRIKKLKFVQISCGCAAKMISRYRIIELPFFPSSLR